MLKAHKWQEPNNLTTNRLTRIMNASAEYRNLSSEKVGHAENTQGHRDLEDRIHFGCRMFGFRKLLCESKAILRYLPTRHLSCSDILGPLCWSACQGTLFGL